MRPGSTGIATRAARHVEPRDAATMNNKILSMPCCVCARHRAATCTRLRRLRIAAAAVALLCMHQQHAKAQAVPPAPAPTAEPQGASSTLHQATDDATCDAECRNRRVAEGWSRDSGEPSPDVTVDALGQRRLTWRGQLDIKTSRNRIESGAPGRVNTPSQGGTPFHASVRSELSLPDLDGSGSSGMQLAAQAGDDRARMPQHRAQVQNVSVSRQGTGYAMQAGDDAANFSQLGLQLGYRGMHAQYDVDGLKAAVIAGTIAESWDALANRTTLDGRPARNRYLRDVAGLYVSREFGLPTGTQTKAFVATAAYRDQGSSIEQALRQAPTVDGRSIAAGVQVRSDPWTFAIEWASSRASQHAQVADPTDPAQTALEGGDPTDTVMRSRSQALTADTTYRFQRGQLRLGARRIGTAFTSASPTVQPGGEEFFVAGDWTPLDGLQLTTDLRRHGTRTAATTLSSGSRTAGHRTQLGLNASLGSWWTWAEGVSLSAQGSTSAQGNPSGGADNRQAQASVGLAWSHRVATVGLTVTDSITRTPAYPGADSNTNGVQAQLGVPFGSPTGEGGWTGQVGITTGRQQQQLASLGATARNTSRGLTLQAGREGVAQITAALQEQVSQPPLGGERVRQRQFQLDAQRPLTKSVDLKLGARWAWHNLRIADTYGRERLLSLELMTRW